MTGGDTLEVRPRGPLRGEITVPGDKSISHRALLLNALGTGAARIRGLLDGADVRSTLAAVRQLGVGVELGAEVVVRPPASLVEPGDVIDCGNSGTSIRLLAGVIAAEPMFAVLTGDASLRRRPMGRVLGPLRQMGAHVDGRGGGDRAPIAVRGGALTFREHDLEVASAQLKTALLLAGRRCGVRVREPSRSRDHTERMLGAMGAGLVEADGWIGLEVGDPWQCIDVDVPGDLSSAAFWMVAGSVVAGSEIVLRGVGVNPTRSGVIDVLRRMGADLEVSPVSFAGAEPVADVIVRAAGLRGVRIDGDLALRSLDELVVLSIAAAFAEGQTEIADAGELRVKESDRIARVAAGLRALGVEVEERPDGMVIAGGAPAVRPGVPRAARVDATGDHRIAMAFSVAGCVAPGGVDVVGAEEIGTSYPTFVETLRRMWS